MKFRYKVLMINIIILSISLGIVGYVMINKNFKLALDTQMRNAVLENNLVQSSVEYELLDIINSNPDEILKTLPEIGTKVRSGMMTSDASIYIMYEDTLAYSSVEGEVPKSIFNNLSIGSKNYIITNENRGFQIYVTSMNQINKKNLCVVTNTDITEVYDMLHDQIAYFKLLLTVILCICSLMMYFISTLLTRPMEKLNMITDSFAKGDYTARAAIDQQDEIGQLAEKFNNMAQSVADHVDELHAMIKRREQFVADFTHEIKTPMTSIIGYADMIRSKELSRERQMIASNYIFSEGKRLERMSKKLFDLIYLGQHEIKLTDVHTVQLIDEVVSSMTPHLEPKHIFLETQVEPAVINGDKELLKTCLINLLDNARKASKEGSAIRLVAAAGEEPGTYTIGVIDEGIGMTPEDAKKICDEFYMIDKSRARKEGGAGLGMSLVAIIVSRHQAHLNIKSEPGRGTTVEIIFDCFGETYKVSPPRDCFGETYKEEVTSDEE